MFIMYFTTFLKFLILGYSLWLWVSRVLSYVIESLSHRPTGFLIQAVNFSRNSEKPAAFDSGGARKMAQQLKAIAT